MVNFNSVSVDPQTGEYAAEDPKSSTLVATVVPCTRARNGKLLNKQREKAKSENRNSDRTKSDSAPFFFCVPAMPTPPWGRRDQKLV